MLSEIRNVFDRQERNKKRYLEVDSLKGFAMFLVILGHGIIVFPINLHKLYPWCEMLYTFIYSFHMPLFFFLSGFCFSYRHDYKSFIKKKLDRLLIPYICFGLLDAVPRILLTKFVNRPLDPEAIIHKLIFLGGEYWFLYVLFGIFLFYPLIFNAYEKNKNYVIFFTVMIFIIACCPISIYTFRIESILYHLVYFNAGYLAKLFFDKICTMKINKRKAMIAIIPVTSFLIITAYLKICYGFGKLEIIPVAFVGIFFSWLLTRIQYFNTFFAPYGKYSLQLYLLNGFTLGLSRYLVCNFMNISDPYLIISVNVIVDFFIAYLFIKYICERFIPIRIMMGL